MKLQKTGPIALLLLGTCILLLTSLLGMTDPNYYRIGVLLSGLGVFSLLLANASLSNPYLSADSHRRDTQCIISDLELLRLFERQAGGLMSQDMVAQKTSLTTTEAGIRLKELTVGGLLRAGRNSSGTRTFFELSATLREAPGLHLSGEAYLTIEDLQEIFNAYDHQVNPHKLMVTTGLSWKVLSREMKHFREQGVIDVVYINRPGDGSKQYILMEQYRRLDGLDLASRSQINTEVRRVLYDERFLV